MKQIDRENLRAWATHGSMSSAFAPTVCAWVTDAIEHIEKLEAQVALLGAALKRDGVLVELADNIVRDCVDVHGEPIGREDGCPLCDSVVAYQEARRGR